MGQMCETPVANSDCVTLNVDFRLCLESHDSHPFDGCRHAAKRAFDLKNTPVPLCACEEV